MLRQAVNALRPALTKSNALNRSYGCSSGSCRGPPQPPTPAAPRSTSGSCVDRADGACVEKSEEQHPWGCAVPKRPSPPWTCEFACNSTPIQECDQIPMAGVLLERDACTEVDLCTLISDKKVLLVGIPGAFTPNCMEDHIMSYVTNYSVAKTRGIDEVICVSNNDPYTMSAWADTMDVGTKLRMLSDPTGDFTKAIGMDVDLSKAGLGPIRSKRYAIYAESGKVRLVVDEPDCVGIDRTMAIPVLKAIEAIQAKDEGRCIRPANTIADASFNTLEVRKLVEAIDKEQTEVCSPPNSPCGTPKDLYIPPRNDVCEQPKDSC